MENTSNILTIKEVAAILRCSKAHVKDWDAFDWDTLSAELRTTAELARELDLWVVRKDLLDQWMEANKTR